MKYKLPLTSYFEASGMLIIKSFSWNLFLFFLLIPRILFSQVLSFDHLTVENGLSNSKINAICQDSTGFLWIGTEDGLNRYDGYSFRIYRNNPGDTNSLPDNTINFLLLDSGDNFWIATFNGVAMFKSEKELFKNIPFYDTAGLRMSVRVHNIIRKYDKGILAATNRGIFQYDEAGESFHPAFLSFKSYSWINFSNIDKIFEDHERNIWIGVFSEGVFKLPYKQKEPEEIKYFIDGQNILGRNKIIHFYEDRTNVLWISTEKGLFGYDQNTGNFSEQLTYRVPRILHNYVNHVTEDSKNNLWISTDGGLSLFNRENGKFSHFIHNDLDEKSLNNNSVSYVFEDTQKNIWVSTKEEGLNVCRSRMLQFYNLVRKPSSALSLNYAYVLSVLEDKQGNIWIGTNGGGINYYNKDKEKVSYHYTQKNRKQGEQNDPIQCILEDKDGIIWFGSYNTGLTSYNPGTKQFTSWLNNFQDPNSLPSSTINTLFEDSHGRLWIGSHAGLSMFNKASGQIIHHSGNKPGDPNPFSSNFISAIVEDEKGFLWIGTLTNGLNKYQPETGLNEKFIHTDAHGSISHNVVNDILIDSRKRIWIATHSGLNLYIPETGTFQHFFVQDGLPNNSILSMVEDDLGNIWLGTNQGLTLFIPEKTRFITFTSRDGIPSTEFARGACYKGKSGFIYFGTKKGISWFDPKTFNASKVSYPLIITGFKIFDTYISPGNSRLVDKNINQVNKLEIKYNQSYLTFEFTALNYINPGKDEFKYYLEGLESGWIKAGPSRMVSYSNLKPGNYVFHLQVTNNLSEFTTQRKIQITVLPPFWKSGLAFVIYFVIISSLIYLIFDFQQNRIEYKNSLLIGRIENEKAIEINQTKLRFFINVSHEFKTPLTLILSPLEKLIYREKELNQEEKNQLYKLIYRNASRLSRLLSQIMDLRKIDAGKMDLKASDTEIVEFIKDIASYFEDQANNHSVEFTFHPMQESIHAWVDREKFEKIMFNLISNAFKYTPDGHKITLTLEKISPEEVDFIEGALKLRIADTGKGIPPELHHKVFERFYQIPHDTPHNPTSSGIGLSIVKEFVELHHGKIELESIPEKGSTFTVYLPLGNKHLKPQELLPGVNEHFFSYSRIEELTGTDVPSTLRKVSEQLNESGRVKKKILVIEDNFELRNFLIDNLDEFFDVYEAADGEEGLALVKEILPEIVLSDVMMPKLTGIELCRAIKSDVMISHIPVLLITVLDAQTSQIEGLESGADDYLIKPFSIQVLELKIKNILENRQKLVQRYMKEVNPDLKQMAQNKTDEEFMIKAIALVEKNMDNTEFSAEDFARELGLSRSNVHVKLKALANQSTTEFIRTMRIKRAAQLLSAKQFNVSEVSFKVGFNNISYFNRCFKKHFGMTPSDYLNAN